MFPMGQPIIGGGIDTNRKQIVDLKMVTLSKIPP